MMLLIGLPEVRLYEVPERHRQARGRSRAAMAASDGAPVGCDLGEDRSILVLLCHGPLPFPLIDQRCDLPPQ
jgi:hypothetical protein